jgi:hypothetical protein
MKNAMNKGCVVTNLHKVAAAAVTGLVLVSAAEMAGIPGTFSANVGFVSEYYFRGISQNDDAPAIQGGIYYMYPGAAGTLNYDFFEIAGSLGYDFGPAAVTASLNYSPDNFGASGTAYYPKLAVSAPVPAVKGLSVNGYVAKQYIKNETAFGSPDYVEWNFGVGYSIAGFDLSLNYSDTDISPSADGKKEAVIFGIKRAF